MTNRYGIVFFTSAIILVGLLISYGIYINYTSNAHVAKMAAAQFFRVEGAQVENRVIEPAIYFPSANIYSPQMSDVHFTLDGTITQIYVKPGDQVKTGQVLGEFTNNEIPSQILQAEGKIRVAEASVAKWENTLKRYQSLLSQDAISRQQIDEAVSNLLAAKGELSAAQAYRDQLASRLESQKVTAPYDGDILKIYHPPGAIVRAGDSLAMIGNLSTLYFETTITNEALQQLQPLNGKYKLAIREHQVIDKAYHSYIRGEDRFEKDFIVQIDEIKPKLDIPAQYRDIVYKITNSSGRLEPGVYYQLKIYAVDKRHVLSVPQEAIITDESEPHVYVINAENRLEKRQIVIGIRDDANVQVKSGVKENELVAVSGKEGGLRPGMKVQLTTSPKRNIVQ